MAGSRSQGQNVIWADSPIRMKHQLSYERAGQTHAISSAWYRGDHCNFNPSWDELRQPNAVVDSILAGWLPDRPQIRSTDKIVAFGSCFAANISDWLNSRNFDVITKDASKSAYVVQFSDAMVTSFAIRQQFEWALEGQQFHQNLWHGKDKRPRSYDEEIRLQTRDLFLGGDVFIITLGLSEIWYDEPTGEVFWRAIPRDEIDTSRHKFRVSTVDENRENIVRIVELIYKYRPDAKVIITLSPIPLAATFRPVSCITANAVSKAILRAAIDEAYRQLKDSKGFYYWPSYEIVTQYFGAPWAADRRHIQREVLDFIMLQFEQIWCEGDHSASELLDKLVLAKIFAGDLPRGILRALRAGDRARLDRVLADLEEQSEPDFALVTSWLAVTAAQAG